MSPPIPPSSVVSARAPQQLSMVPARRRNERGYVMTMMVLLLPLLIGFLALAVDATYFWFRGVQLQRAADAASLAGVTRMPKFNEATSTANEIAKRNGFIDGEQNVSVTVARIPRNNKRLQVTIKDDAVGLFFGRIFANSWSTQKTSVAEYISNIPLGSRENAIGTGYLTDTAAGPKQNFWLAVAGPCTPKEAGDQFASRWDGNGVNGSQHLSPVDPESRYALLCHVDPATVGNQSGTGYLLAQRALKLTVRPGLFPALVENRDWAIGRNGYDYIVDVPCYAAAGAAISPPPCDGGGQTIPGDLIIQMYDPAFNPDSIQRWAQPMQNLPSETRKQVWTNEVDDRLKPDKFALNRPAGMKGCVTTGSPSAAATVGNCQNVDLGTNNPKPWDVRVSTDVRVYPPDSTPLDYTNDAAMQFSGVDNIVPLADPLVTPLDGNAGIRRFGSCLNWTDPWTLFRDPLSTGDPTKFEFASRPVATSTDFTPGTVPAGWSADTQLAIAGTDIMSPAQCTAYSNKWVTVARVNASSGAARGRYRLNLRTIDTLNSFGHNNFGVRAFFVPAATPEPVAYPACLMATPVNCTAPKQEASVSGDSTMSVYASVNDVSLFYLAQLSPAKLYRNKTVLVSLWDPGEGAEKLEVLRPRGVSPSLEPVATCAVDVTAAEYCGESFKWSVGRPGLSVWDPGDPFLGVSGNGADYQDVCADKGKPLPADVSDPTFLTVSGEQDAVEGCASLSHPSDILNSRGFAALSGQGKFNDRLVTLAIKIPDNYGCAVGTGIVLSNGTAVPCIDVEDTPAGPLLPPPGLPEGGWWKIKYTPELDPLGGYKKITDRTTWSVGLRGDPVHLVPSGQ